MSRDTLTPEQRGLLLDAVQDTVRDTAAPGHVDDLREALAARGLAVVPELPDPGEPTVTRYSDEPGWSTTEWPINGSSAGVRLVIGPGRSDITPPPYFPISPDQVLTLAAALIAAANTATRSDAAGGGNDAQ